MKRFDVIGTTAESTTPPLGGWTRSSDGRGMYRVASGDYLSRIAQRFLNNGNRWPEIWAIQPAVYRTARGSANNLRVGDVLLMPDEATRTAERLGLLESQGAPLAGGTITVVAPQTPAPPAAPLAPASASGGPPALTLAQRWAALTPNQKLAVAGGGAAAVAAAVYLATEG